MGKPKLWTKDFIIVSVANFFLYITFYLLISTITVFATNQFHASPSAAGLASGIFVLGALVGRLYSGKSIEFIGRKRMLYIGLILFVCITLLYFVINSMTFLLVTRFLHGAAFGIASTATGTIVASIIPNERRGEGTGYYALSLTIAAAIGPFLGMFINQHIGFYMNFILCTILLGVSLLATFFLTVSKETFTKEQLENMKGFKLSNFFEAKAIPISLVAIVVGLCYSSILSFLTSYSQEIHLVDMASFFFIFYAVATLVSRPFSGRWFDIKGENFVMYPSFILFAIGLVLLSQAVQGYFILLAGLFVGVGYGTFSSSAQALSVKVSPKHRMGLATSTYYIFIDLGIGLGPFLLGFLIPVMGFKGLYEFLAVVVVASIFLYYFIHGKKATQLEQANKLAS